jgi:hypothetical protein
LYELRARVYHRVPTQRARWGYFRAAFLRDYRKRWWRALSVRVTACRRNAYTLRTLPRGVLRGLADMIRRHDFAGLVRSAVIMLGLTMTAWGHAYGLVSLRRINEPAARRLVSPISLTDGNGQE